MSEVYCPQCDYDRHICGGCGEHLQHGEYACEECKIDLDELIGDAWDLTEGDDGSRYAQYLLSTLADALVSVRAERDAALAAIERVRAIHTPTLPGYGPKSCVHDGRAWPCPTIAALDRAPEPEWEWGYRGETLIDVHPRKSRESAEGAVKDLTEYWALHGKKFELVRRRPAGPWLPVEREKP